MSLISPETIQAYRETEYRVLAEPAFVLRISEASAELLNLYSCFGVSCAAFVTACNPYSAAFLDDDNRERQAKLERELRSRRLRFLPGIGQHPSNEWPGEPSFLILALSLASARALGERLEQNAIVWAGEDGVPQLVLLR
jgi:Protein of unknown function (DUF3293)